jgi:hypothetical protein
VLSGETSWPDAFVAIGTLVAMVAMIWIIRRDK